MSKHVPTVAVVATKGGTGKTVVAGNLAAALAAEGYRVTAVDTDPQADLGFDLGAEPSEVTLADVLDAHFAERPAPETAAIETAIDGVQLIQGGTSLDEIQGDLVRAEAEGESLLAAALDSLEDLGDVVVIDTPPSVGPLTVGAIIAADLVLLPVSAQDQRAINSLPATMDLIERLREAERTRARAYTVATRVDSRRFRPRRLSASITEVLGSDGVFGIELLGRISEHVSVQHAPAEGRPTVAARPSGRVGLEFGKLADAVVDRLALKKMEVAA